jgi:hypothetical protein
MFAAQGLALVAGEREEARHRNAKSHENAQKTRRVPTCLLHLERMAGEDFPRENSLLA